MRDVVGLACFASLAGAGAVLTSGCTTTARSGPVDEAVFYSQSDFVIETLVRGQPLRLKVDPGAPWYVLLNASAAKRLGLVGTRSAIFAERKLQRRADLYNAMKTLCLSQQTRGDGGSGPCLIR